MQIHQRIAHVVSVRDAISERELADIKAETRCEAVEIRQTISDAEFATLLQTTYTSGVVLVKDTARQRLYEILDDASAIHVTDLHFEHTATHGVIRQRRDRELLDQLSVIVSTETMDGMLNILRDEVHVGSQDPLPWGGARFLLPSGRSLDIRAQFFPIRDHRQEAVLRLIGTATRNFSLEELELPEIVLHILRRTAEGMKLGHLVIGPMNSGKSTLMRAIARLVIDVIRHRSNGKATPKIISAEAPIEVVMPYTQIEINPDVGVTTERILETIVRSDNDLAMIAEINSAKTAQLFISSAMAGRFVLASFHARDAIDAIVRLLGYVDAPSLQAGLGSITAVRLLERLCRACRKPVLATAEVHSWFRQKNVQAPREIFQRGDGCHQCDGVGVRGLKAIYEILPITSDIADAIGVGTAAAIREAASSTERRTTYYQLAHSALTALADGDISSAAMFEALHFA
ncbi:MAG: ATPase, T2SS/T4P/T4SS family [Vulcanimicrobiaceae bacterium]